MANRKWVFDLNSNNNEKHRSLQEPLGFSDFTFSEEVSTKQQKASNIDLKLKKAWEVGQSPARSILMTLFMAWMSGNSVNIFSIMITIYSFINPFRAIMGVGAVFAPYEDPNLNLLPQKLTFIAINLVTLTIAAYKGYVLGILPTANDWMASMPPLQFAATVVLT